MITADGGDDPQHRRPRVAGLGSWLTPWPALCGLMFAGCGAAQGYVNLVLTDPYLHGMKFGMATLPDGWKAHGSIGRPTCGALAGQPSGVPEITLRAESADAQMQLRIPPAPMWQWKNTLITGRKLPHHPTPVPGCLPIFGPVSAAQFVRLYAQQYMRDVRIVGSASFLPKAQAAIAKQKVAAIRSAQMYTRQHPGASSLRQTFDAAAIRVESDSHGERRVGFLSAGVRCTEMAPAPSNGGPNPVQIPTGYCTANLTYYAAPPGKLMQMRRLLATMPPLKISRHYMAMWSSAIMTRDLRDLEENPAFRAWQWQNEREKAQELQELQERLNTEVPDNRYLQNSALWKAGQVQNHAASVGQPN